MIKYITLVCLLTVGCMSHTTNTPGGRSSNTTVLGLMSVSRTNTADRFKECMEELKRAHPGDQPLIDRDVHDKCYGETMAGVEPRGQYPYPTPVDGDGDGRPGGVRYANGMQIPYEWIYGNWVGYGASGTNLYSAAYDPLQTGYATQQQTQQQSAKQPTAATDASAATAAPDAPDAPAPAATDDDAPMTKKQGELIVREVVNINRRVVGIERKLEPDTKTSK